MGYLGHQNYNKLFGTLTINHELGKGMEVRRVTHIILFQACRRNKWYQSTGRGKQSALKFIMKLHEQNDQIEHTGRAIPVTIPKWMDQRFFTNWMYQQFFVEIGLQVTQCSFSA